MTKRNITSLRESDDDGHIEKKASIGIPDTHKQEIIADIIRMVLSKISRNMRIRREHVSSILQALNSRIPLKQWLIATKEELTRIYGLTLEQSGVEILVFSSLNSESANLYSSLFGPDVSQIDFQADSLSSMYLIQKSKRGLSSINAPEKVLGGITMLIISVIILSRDKISESDLLESLSGFGMSENLNITVPLLNKSVQGVLSEITRRDYIKKSTSNAANGPERSASFVEYSLGDRSKREFKPQCIYEFFLQVYRDDSIKDRLFTSLKHCFPDFTINTNDVAMLHESLTSTSVNTPS